MPWWHVYPRFPSLTDLVVGHAGGNPSQLLKSRSSDCVTTCIRKRPYAYTQFLKNQFRPLNWYPPTEELLLRLCYLVHKYEKQMAILTCIPPGFPWLTDLVIRHAGGGIPTTEELLLTSCHPVHTYQNMAAVTYIYIYSQFLSLTDLVGKHASGNVTTDEPLLSHCGIWCTYELT